MADASILGTIATLIGAVAGGGLAGAWFTHRREQPKAEADANHTAAETVNMDWARFQKEIARLDSKVAAQDKRIGHLETELTKCHEEHEKAKGRIIELEAANLGRGQLAQDAQAMISADRVAQRRAGA